jgi:SAM-dependent methyltransferase
MRADWDAMASQNAHYYILTWQEFADPDAIDEQRFFATGRAVVDDMLACLHVVPAPDWKVLDIGCGIGRLTRRLAEIAPDTIGVDVSPRMVDRARRLTPHLRFEVVSGDDLSGFAANTFDLVFSFVVFQHVPSHRITLRYVSEMARVLKPGGLATFQAPTTLSSPLRRLLNWRRPKPHRDPNQARASFRGSVLHRGELQKHGASVGLLTEVVLFEGTPYTYFRLRKLAGAVPSCSLEELRGHAPMQAD